MEKNLVKQWSLFHWLFTGHKKEHRHLYWDYNGDYYDSECDLCHCPRIELGYNCRGESCKHGRNA